MIRKVLFGEEFIISLILLFGSFYLHAQIPSKSDTDFAKLPAPTIKDISVAGNNFNSGMQEYGYIPVFDRNPSEHNTFTVFTRSTYSTLYIFAPNGEPLYYKSLNNYGYDFKLLPDNTLSYFDQERVGYVIMDEYFNEIDFIEAKNGFETDFHEFFYHDNAYFLLAKDTRDIDMSTIVEGGKEDAKVIGIVIQKIDKEHNLVFEWNSFEYFEIKDSYGKLKVQTVDPFHINSIEMDTDSTILISTRNLNEITKINLNNGEIIWRMGGENNEFEFIGFDRPFAGQHTLNKREGQLYTLFDNGLEQEPEYSRGLIIEINEEQRQVKLIKEFRHSPDIYSRIVGNIQNLDNGNFLIYWGINTGLEVDGSFTVYDEDYNLIEEAKLLNTLAYRVYKFNWRPKNFSTDEEVLVFPDTEIGDTTLTELNLRNNTGKSIVIDELIWKNESFQLNTSNPVTILPGNDYPLPIRFSP
ncbi:MAG: arylsulfotransferase family protein, partial [Bacteroidales bacterium]